MITEIEKAMEITKHMMKQKSNNKISWKRLFKKFPFFKAYSHFIQIQILSENQEVHEKWKGYVESKVRILLRNLETVNTRQFNCLEFRPWPKAYQLAQAEGSTFQINDTYYFGIRVKQDPNQENIRERYPQIDLTKEREKFFQKLKGLIENPERTNELYLNYLQ
jgi:poly(A) polymerase Pap1